MAFDFSKFLLGSQGGFEQLNRLNPQQTAASDQILQMALQQLQNPQSGFQPIADQARQQFKQQTIPSIAERFTGMGGQRSSAFQQQLGQAGSGLESMLASLGSQYGQKQQGLAQSLLSQGLQPQFENIYRPGQAGFLENLFSQLIGAGGSAAGYYAQQNPGMIQNAMTKLLPLLLGL